MSVSGVGGPGGGQQFPSEETRAMANLNNAAEAFKAHPSENTLADVEDAVSTLKPVAAPPVKDQIEEMEQVIGQLKHAPSNEESKWRMRLIEELEDASSPAVAQLNQMLGNMVKDYKEKNI